MNLSFNELAELASNKDFVNIDDNEIRNVLLKTREEFSSIVQTVKLIDLENKLFKKNDFSNLYSRLNTDIVETKESLEPIYFANKRNITKPIAYAVLIGGGITAGIMSYDAMPQTVNDVTKLVSSGTAGFLAGTTSSLIFESLIKKSKSLIHRKKISKANQAISNLVESIEEYNKEYPIFCDLLKERNIRKKDYLDKTYSKVNTVLNTYKNVLKSNSQ